MITFSREDEIPLEQNERYLGGLYSPMQLSLGTFGVGAGIYATNKRLFLFREDMDSTFNKMVSGSGRKDFNPASLTSEQNQAIVKELSTRCPPQNRILKEEIASLELKKPPGMFRTGHLEIQPTNSKSVKLVIGGKTEYDYVLWLLQQFNPQVLRQV